VAARITKQLEMFRVTCTRHLLSSPLSTKRNKPLQDPLCDSEGTSTIWGLMGFWTPSIVQYSKENLEHDVSETGPVIAASSF
jgi:hypothetical protein